MAEFPALSLWTDAYLADTADLNVGEHGCYLLLLMIAWRRPDCALLNDMKWMRHTLNAYCGGSMHGNRFNAIVPKLLNRFFTLGADGKWQQKRLRKERDFVLNLKRIQSENVQKRWAKVRENKELADTAVLPPLYPHTHTYKERSLRDPKKGNDHDAKEHSRGCRLNADWQPCASDTEFAKEAGLEPFRIAATADRFRDHWLGAAGPNAVKRDWSAAWRNWVRKDLEDRATGMPKEQRRDPHGRRVG